MQFVDIFFVILSKCLCMNEWFRWHRIFRSWSWTGCIFFGLELGRESSAELSIALVFFYSLSGMKNILIATVEWNVSYHMIHNIWIIFMSHKKLNEFSERWYKSIANDAQWPTEHRKAGKSLDQWDFLISTNQNSLKTYLSGVKRFFNIQSNLSQLHWRTQLGIPGSSGGNVHVQETLFSMPFNCYLDLRYWKK